MKFKLRGGINPDLVKLVYENRNVDFNNKEGFLNPTAEDRMCPSIYINMQQAFENLAHHIRNGLKICILVDSDCDGICSGAMMYLYIRDVIGYKNVVYMLHEGRKAHGLSKEIMARLIADKPDLLIIPDAGSNDFKEHKVLKQFGVDIIVIDHHKADKYSDDAIVVNNQLQEGVNHTLSGAGMVLKFLEYVDIVAGLNGAEYFYDLTAIALVADSMEITHPETRYYVMEGLRRINNPLLQTLLGDKEEKNFRTISFDVAPSLNAIIRIGDIEEQQDLFKAMTTNTNEMVFMNIRGRGEVEMTFTESIKLISDRLKSKQARMIKKVLESESTIVITQNLPFTIVIFDNEEFKNLSGLIASKIVDKYNKPAIVVCEKDDGYAGSARTTDYYPNFKTYLTKTNMFKYALGHEGAFGCAINKTNLSSLTVKLLNSTLGDDAYVVDKSYADGYIPATEIFAMFDMKHLWCKGFEEPIFHVKLKDVQQAHINIIGKNKDTVKFKSNYIDFVKFKCSYEEIESLIGDSPVDIELIGKFDVNEWNGRSFPQVKIEDMKVKKSVNMNNINFGQLNLFGL
ncbi:MAG: DHH family phosphoesterase [Paraclostridium sp.]